MIARVSGLAPSDFPALLVTMRQRSTAAGKFTVHSTSACPYLGQLVQHGDSLKKLEPTLQI